MFLYEFKVKETYFTRIEISKMKFNDIILFILNDGIVLQLHDSENLSNVLGYIENQNSKVARARDSALYDIENGMIIASKLGGFLYFQN